MFLLGNKEVRGLKTHRYRRDEAILLHRSKECPKGLAYVSGRMIVRPQDRSPSSEQIAIRAYHLWVARGQPGGTDWDDWLEAERRLAASA